MSDKINIQAAFILGCVGFAGLEERATPPQVEIIATQDRHTVNEFVHGVAGQASRYCLVVKPGKWFVTAKWGSLKSQPKEVTLNPGQSLELDIVFGVQGL